MLRVIDKMEVEEGDGYDGGSKVSECADFPYRY
jgi:hypothetical protein